MQTARARTRHAARPRTGRAAGPATYPRRVSGPLRPQPVGAPIRRGATGVFERLRALPEHRVIDRLLRGRYWIWLIGIMLGGIVAMQVSLLKLNTGISRAVTTTGTLERQNAALESEIARLSSSERIRDAATAKGMIEPAAGSTSYLHARPDRDPNRAVQRMVPPSDEATEVMINGGREPGVLAAPDPAATAPAPATVTDPAATAPAVTNPAATAPAVTDPAATAPAATDPAVTEPAPDPATVPAPAPTAVPETGAIAAPGQG
jgi:cell division protein FtsL